jgi:anti-sigma regulatory factor (Ser/Thr protein kinase)
VADGSAVRPIVRELDHTSLRGRGMRLARGCLVSDTRQWVLAADERAPELTRSLLNAWLDELRISAQRCDDVLLALTEAVSNVVNHGYWPSGNGGTVSVRVQCRPGECNNCRRVILTVTDTGRWRVPARPVNDRGRGPHRMWACTAAMRIEKTRTGTQVTMTSRPIPAGDLGREHATG